MSLKERCANFLNEFDIPKTHFCKKIELSTVSYSKWQKGQLKLSNETEKRIDTYLLKYGF